MLAKIRCLVLSRHDAVSPVIAVILLVALTVILVVVVGAAVMGLFDTSALTGKVVGVTAESYGTSTDHGVRLTVWGGKDFDQLVSIRAEIGEYELVTPDGKRELTDVVVGGKYDFMLKAVSYNFTEESGVKTNVTTTKVNNTEALLGLPVNFIGTFTDGTEQVIYMWKLSLPEVDVNPGLYSGADANISVMGYTNTSGIPGHGICIERLNINVKSVEVTGIDLKRVSDGGNYKDSISANLGKQAQSVQFFSGNGRIYIPTKQSGSGDKEENVYVPYPNKSISAELTGTVTLKVTMEGGETYTKDYTIEMLRRSTFNEPAYRGSITGYNSGTKKLTFSLANINVKGNRYALAVVDSSSTVKDQKQYTGISPEGTSCTVNFDSSGYASSDVVEVYAYYDTGGSQVFYLIAKKTIAELLALS